jgi:hypothetical protein
MKYRPSLPNRTGASSIGCLSTGVKKPSESKYDRDYSQLVSTIKSEDAFRPLDRGECPFMNT